MTVAVLVDSFIRNLDRSAIRAENRKRAHTGFFLRDGDEFGDFSFCRQRNAYSDAYSGWQTRAER
jgi:hypothetical protein